MKEKSLMIPKFEFSRHIGQFINNASKAKIFNDFLFLSLDQRVYQYHINSKELVKIYGSIDQNISSFFIDNDCILLGCSGGILETIFYSSSSQNHTLRMHKKRITKCIKINNLIISGSKDGFISIYNIMDEKTDFVSIEAAVVDFYYSDNILWVATGNKTIKKYVVQNGKYTCNHIIQFDDFLSFLVFKTKEIFCITHKGSSFLIDLDSLQVKSFNVFKKTRTVNCEKNTLLIHCASSVHVFSVKDERFGFSNEKKHKTTQDDLMVLINKENLNKKDNNEINFLSISSSNKFYTWKTAEDYQINKKDSFWHEGPILNAFEENDILYTISKDTLCVWNVYENISLINKIKLKNCINFILTDKQIFILTQESFSVIYALNKSTLEILEEHKIECSCFALYNNLVAICNKNKLTIYVDFKDQIASFILPDIAVNCLFGSDGKLFVSCLDAKVYLIQCQGSDIKILMTFYGHSLPVKTMVFEENNNILFTFGADKTIKIWGLDFGECRKTVTSDFGTNVIFIDKEELVWMYQNNNKINIVSGFNTIYHIKNESKEKTKLFLTKSFLLSTSESGLRVFNCLEDEYISNTAISNNNVEEKHLYKNTFMTNYDTYERFEMFLEKLQESSFSQNFETSDSLNGLNKNTNSIVLEFVGFLDCKSFVEITQLLYILEDENVFLLLNVIYLSLKDNLIFCSRFYSELYKIHRTTIEKYILLEELKKALKENLISLRDKIGINWANIILETDGVYEKE
ncbi:hypothetical protein EHP00_1029 [Ecytonucleospora hepatopenaei]|uniref:Uncharacterized protein n=1 Tax=Ecytonucleospora hepatopenaei TaxID=646526 RepID=A0A1W0E513_9MICR|nr:hypothetical protein EHP00_1029 [Ecytonucleospora hepatopenaei]